MHTTGWPVDRRTYGGSFLYHLENNQVAVGFVIGLDYENPWISPFDEFQRFKTHPAIRGFFEDGRRIAYGARAITEGGFQSLPKLTFPGGMLVGDTAGFLNVRQDQGHPHRDEIGHDRGRGGVRRAGAGRHAGGDKLSAKGARRPGSGTSCTGCATSAPRFTGVSGAASCIRRSTRSCSGARRPGRCTITTTTAQLKKAADCPQIEYPKPDGKLTFDKLSSVFISNVNHEENQLCHLTLKDARSR